MPRNIEIKARIPDADALRSRAQALADGPAVLVEQDDSFFHATHGRLKLREAGDGRGVLIHYERPDIEQAKASDYQLLPVADPAATRELLARACGLAGRVRKQRWLLMRGQTRIHIDRVEGLGDFMDLEVVLRPEQDDAEGVRIAEALMHELGLAEAPRERGAYVDLLGTAARAGGTTSARKS